MFMFVPKFNFLIICENMKKSLNNKNHFPSFHFCLIVIISLGATLWQFCCCPLGMAACRCLFSLGKTIIIVPEKEKVFLDMLCRGRSTGKKKSSALGLELSSFWRTVSSTWIDGKVLPEHLTHTCVWNPFSQALQKVIFYSVRAQRVLACMLDILL